MPPPKKIDLIPPKLRTELKAFLTENGFGRIEDATDLLNEWLAAEGKDMTLGKTAVGKYAQLLKDQNAAYQVADELLSGAGIEKEAEMHRAIMHMIAGQCINLMVDVREEDGQFDPKSLAALSKMLKDLMSSAGIREKLLASEEDRIARKARKQAADDIDAAAPQLGLTADSAAKLRRHLLGARD